MTLFDRVRELDRLYLAHDALCRLLDAASPVQQKWLCREARRAWARYVALRDSRRGLNERVRGKHA